MSTPNPFEQAAAPALIAVLKSAQTMITTITTGDATTAGLRAGPALQVFLGQVGLQVPALATAELGAAGTAANTQINNWISTLEAAQASAAAK